jgi:predicted nucleic acid-binding protein
VILYLDTSAYVRLYVREPGHDQVWNAAQGAARVASHLIAYAEMRAALARMRRMNRLAGAQVNSIRKTFEEDWRETLRITPTEAMVLRAGDLADRFGLGGYDSVHLAAAESLRSGRRTDLVSFASFDRLLNRAAQEIGLPVLPVG